MPHVPGTFTSFGPLRFGLLSVILLTGVGAHAQSRVSKAVRIETLIDKSDLAALNAEQERKDFQCDMEIVQPFLDFDLRLHSGYRATVPLRNLAGAGRVLAVFRVTPEERPGAPVYFSQEFEVPPLSADAKGYASFSGLFDLGVGKYRVDWLIRNSNQHVYASHWQLDAKPPKVGGTLALTLPPGTVQEFTSDRFRAETPMGGSRDGLYVKVLVNFAPQDDRETVLRNTDLDALVSILRSIAREPRFSRFSLTAVNVNEERIIHRQDTADSIDFPALGASLAHSNPGTIDVKQLEQKHGRSVFLTKLFNEAMGSAERPDMLIIVGPKAMLSQKAALDGIRAAGGPDCPVVYLNYLANPLANPWKDTIADAVKSLKGHIYTITKPRDLWSAWSSMLEQTVAARRPGRTVASALRPTRN